MQHYHTTSPRHDAGFTLIELAVVLVVIGLVTAGVVVGRTMIRAAEVREAMSEYGRYVQAIGEFKDKYRALPGDLRNATEYWGDNGSCPEGTISIRGTATCNGNGDGIIGTSDGLGMYKSDVGTALEWFTAWQQLANAGFIEGLFTGSRWTVGTRQSWPGMNVPTSKLTRGGWSIFYYSSAATTADLRTGYGPYGHILALGAASSSADEPTIYPVLSPQEAREIDTKMDDGIPSLGTIRSMRKGNSYTTSCIATDANPNTDTYATGTSIDCALLFITNF